MTKVPPGGFNPWRTIHFSGALFPAASSLSRRSRMMTFYGRNLPHCQPPDEDRFLTWRLKGSLPSDIRGMSSKDDPAIAIATAIANWIAPPMAFTGGDSRQSPSRFSRFA